MVDRRGEDLARLFKVAFGVQHPIDFGPIFGPLLDLVEIAVVRCRRTLAKFLCPELESGTLVHGYRQAPRRAAGL
jgi:hypothetical protein